MQWDIVLDKHSDTPLYRQLGDALAELIVQGKLVPGNRLPPIRQMAHIFDVNNTTVVSAYKYLERKAVVYSVVGSGTFVAQPMPVSAPLVQIAAPSNIAADYINFADITANAALFPVATFRRALNTVLDRDGGVAFGYHDSQGYLPLRVSLCQLQDGLSISPDHIHIVSGAKQGLDILANAILEPGDTVFVEQPAPQSAVAAFQSRRVLIVEMPLAKDGPDFQALEALLKRHRPKLFYVTPNFQQPFGICYSAESKRRLLELAYAIDAHIVEEDQYSDFYYDGVKRIPLKTMDYNDRVIYIKSFSRIMMPGLGIGFMACPSSVSEAINKINADITPPGYIQRAFDIFLRSGDYVSHTANIREVYGRLYQKMAQAVSTYLASLADFELPGGGLSLWVTPHTTHGNKVGDYADKILQRKVVVSPGQLFAVPGTDLPGFRISFAAVPEERIAEGIGAIASVLAGI